MTHVVQFTNLPDFLADLDTGETAVVYHQLIEQRTATSDYGMTRWILTTIIRAIVANGRVLHLAALTFPHGPQVQRINGVTFGPRDVDTPTRWQDAARRHDAIIDELRSHLGIRVTDLPGILNVPADLPLVFAVHPLDELADELVETTA